MPKNDQIQLELAMKKLNPLFRGKSPQSCLFSWPTKQKVICLKWSIMQGSSLLVAPKIEFGCFMGPRKTNVVCHITVVTPYQAKRFIVTREETKKFRDPKP